MKKVALSLMALALVGTSAFAADSTAGTDIPAPLTATLAANGWGQVGMDLDTGSFGFKNGTEAKITLNILNGNNEKGTEGVTGYIKVEDIKFRFDGSTGGAPTATMGRVSAADETKAAVARDKILNDVASTQAQKDAANSDYMKAVYPVTVAGNGAAVLTIGSVTAKLMLGDLYVKIAGNSEANVNYTVDGDDDNGGASIVADDAFYTYSGLYGDTKTEWQVGKLGKGEAFAGTGFEVGYTVPKTVSFVATVAAENVGWSSTDKDGQDFEGSLVVGLLAVDKLTLNAKGYLGSIDAKNWMGMGAEAAYDLGVVAPFLHLNAMADKAIDKNSDGYYDLDAGAKLPLVDGLKAVALVKYDSASVVDFAVTADLAKAKLAGPVSAQFGLWLRDVTAAKAAKANKTDIFGKVAVDVADGVSVWGKGSFATTGADKTDSIFVKAGVEASKLLPLTTFSAEWHSNDFGGAKTTKIGADAVTLGQIFLQAKVAY